MWRTRKPSAYFGISLRVLLLATALLALVLYAAGAWWWVALVLPCFSGRHTAYVGQTGSRYFRDQQHLHGSTKYGSTGKPWSDLDPKVYALPVLLPHVKWFRERQEWIYIKLLLPVYNIEYNSTNPRRITKRGAEHQRAMREELGLKFNVGRAFVRGTVAAGFWIIIAWGAWQSWS